MEYICDQIARLKFCVHLSSVHIHTHKKKKGGDLLPTYQKLELQNNIGLQRKRIEEEYQTKSL